METTMTQITLKQVPENHKDFLTLFQEPDSDITDAGILDYVVLAYDNR